MADAELATEVVGGGHGEKLDGTIVADRRADDELHLEVLSLGCSPAADRVVRPGILWLRWFNP